MNIRISGDPSNQVSSKVASYTETSTAPIVEDSSQWSLSVVRFNLTTNEMPVYVFEDVPGSGVYKYNVILTVSGIRVEIPVDFTLIGSSSPYENTRAFFSYVGLIEGINLAYSTALSALQATYALQIGTWPVGFPTEPPKLRLLSSDKLQFYFTPSYQSNSVAIGVNPALVNKMGSFSWSIQPAAPYDAFLDIADKGWNHVTYSSTNYLYAEEPGQSIQNWNSVRQIVFKTAIPVQSEYRSGQNIDRDQVLTDYDLAGVIDGTDINFFPTGPLREYPLYNREALYEISLKILWRDIKGLDHNWLLGPDDLATMKLEFRKR